MIEKIAELEGFDYEIQLEATFGAMDENGTWNGAISKLLNGEADIALGAMSVMAEREAAIDFTVPFYEMVGISILTKVPVVHYHFFQFVKVIESDAWYSIIGAYFLTRYDGVVHSNTDFLRKS